MVTYRKARPEEREAYIRFADMVFTDSGTPISFEASIPKVYGAHIDSSSMHYLAVDDEKGIRGLVAVMPNLLHVGEETLKIGYIGSVSVHPQARGEGHMKRLMQMAIADMKADGVDIALLGGQRQRYEYFGFSKGGVGYSVTIDKPNVRHALKHVDASQVTFVQLNHESPWVDAAHALYEKQSIRFHRNRPEFVDICCNYLHRPWVILEEGRFAGYLICNESGDSIVEMQVGSADMLDKALKAWITQFGQDRIRLSFPVWQTNLLKRVGRYAEWTSCDMRVQSSIYNPRRVLRALLAAKATFARLENADMAFNIEGDRFTVTVEDGEVRVTDGGETSVCLDTLQATQLFAYPFDYEGRPKTPEGWFPLPLYEVAPDGF